MSVHSVSSPNHSFTLETNNNKVISQLEREKAKLQERIQKINEGDEDPKVKQEKVKDIQEQIRQIEGQIQQCRMEKMREMQNNSEKSSNSSNENIQANQDGDILSLSGMTQAIDAAGSYNSLKTVSRAKKGMEDTSRILELEIKQDGSRGADTEQKSKQLSEIKSRINDINGRLRDINQNINDKLNKTDDSKKQADKDEDKDGVKEKASDEKGVRNFKI